MAFFFEQKDTDEECDPECGYRDYLNVQWKYFFFLKCFNVGSECFVVEEPCV